MQTYFTSDLHFHHLRIQEFTGRPWNHEEQTEEIISIWNSQVKPGDTIFHIGDFCFGVNKVESIEKIVKRLNGNIFFIIGNHDTKNHFINLYSKFGGRILGVEYFKQIKLNKKRITLCHFPLVVWENSHHGSWSLHGHCMDNETEVLTEEGFKFRKDLNFLDRVATLNLTNGNTEYQNINEFVDVQYSGDQYMIEGRNINGVFTDNHTVIHTKYRKPNDYLKSFYKDISNEKQICIPLNGKNNNPDYTISDILLKLYIQMVTDGSIENKTLGRFHFKKERKIKRVEDILNELEIPYSKNLQGRGTTKINFRIPEEILKYSIKPLDKFVLKLSQRQVDILVNEYAITDGYRSSKNSIQISTAKKEEAELLQQLLVTSNYSCNLTKRKDDKYERYVLALNTKDFWVSDFKKKPILKESVIEKSFWCLKVDNQSLFIRRKGKVHVTGNCHGSYIHPGKALDVGIDNSIKVLGEYRLFDFEDIKKYMDTKEIWTPDFHNTETT